MKIAMLTDPYWPRINGVTVSVDAYSHALIRAGHEVVIVCTAYPEAVRLPSCGGQGEPQIIQVPSIPVPVSMEDRLAKFGKFFWVVKQLESFKPDIIHINSEFVIAEFGFLYAKLHHLPVVYTFHTLWEEYIGNYFPLLPVPLLKHLARRGLKSMLKRTDLIIVPTVQIQELVKKYKIKKETCLLPTGIEAQFFNQNPLQAAYFRGLLEERYPALRYKRILLFVGRITKEKNVAFLLNILPGIVTKHPEAVLLVVGDGPETPALKKECERLGLGEHCVFAGYLERGDIALAYAMSDIFVFPSLTETQGLVTLEAMASGIPVVAIGSMGTLMVMGGDNGGFMVQNDPEEFTRRVFDLLEDYGLYNRKALEAKNYAKKWLIDGMTVKLVEIYQQALTIRPGVGGAETQKKA